jgi:hypothetical protein
MILPIEPYLIELVQRMQQRGISLTVAGGLGIYLKHRWVLQQIETGHRTPPLMDIPDARATEDIDAFFGLEVYLQPTRADLREILRELGYKPCTDYLMFEKTLSGDPERKISLDLLSPLTDDSRIKIDKPTKPGKLRRFGPKDNRNSPPEQRLHAYATPEAFAIDELPRTLPLRGNTPLGEPYEGDVRVPHPFASLCMKIQAAADYEHATPIERNPRGQKHAPDVYLVLAMLNETEWDECSHLCEQFSDHPELESIRAAVEKLFTDPRQPACVTIGRTTPAADLGRFSELITELFE